MEQMMGVSKSLPDDLVEEIARANTTSKWQDSFDLARTILGLAGNHFSLARKMRRLYHPLQHALKHPQKPLQKQSADKFGASFRPALARPLIRRHTTPLHQL